MQVSNLGIIFVKGTILQLNIVYDFPKKFTKRHMAPSVIQR